MRIGEIAQATNLVENSTHKRSRQILNAVCTIDRPLLSELVLSTTVYRRKRIEHAPLD